jgi:hypothetical protein
MSSLFGSILPGNGDTFEGLDDDDSEDRADEQTDDEQTESDTDG